MVPRLMSKTFTTTYFYNSLTFQESKPDLMKSLNQHATMITNVCVPQIPFVQPNPNSLQQY